MLKQLKRRWNYFNAKMNRRFEESADPKIQLEQAIDEARQQHRRLKDQAANVIANQKQTEMRLSRALEDLERANTNVQHALLMADEAIVRGDTAKVDSYTAVAERIAESMITMEHEVDNLKALHFQATQAADQAKAAVNQNALGLQEKLRERQRLLGQIDQARMQEQMNDAMGSLTESVGEDVPTFNEVRDKIEARYAKAKGVAELSSVASDPGGVAGMLEVEAAARQNEARARIAKLRSQLGITAGSNAGEIASGGTTPKSIAAPQTEAANERESNSKKTA